MNYYYYYSLSSQPIHYNTPVTKIFVFSESANHSKFQTLPPYFFFSGWSEFVYHTRHLTCDQTLIFIPLPRKEYGRAEAEEGEDGRGNGRFGKYFGECIWIIVSGFPSIPPIIAAWEFFAFFFLDLRSLDLSVSINGGFSVLVDCLFIPEIHTTTTTNNTHTSIHTSTHTSTLEAIRLFSSVSSCKTGARAGVLLLERKWNFVGRMEWMGWMDRDMKGERGVEKFNVV